MCWSFMPINYYIYVRPTFLACQHNVCRFWGFHNGVAQDSILLGYESIGNHIPIFLGSVVTSSSWVKMSKQTFWGHYIASNSWNPIPEYYIQENHNPKNILLQKQKLSLYNEINIPVNFWIKCAGNQDSISEIQRYFHKCTHVVHYFIKIR